MVICGGPTCKLNILRGFSQDIAWMPVQLYFTDLNLGEDSSQTQSLDLTVSPGFPAGPIGPGAPSDP